MYPNSIKNTSRFISLKKNYAFLLLIGFFVFLSALLLYFNQSFFYQQDEYYYFWTLNHSSLQDLLIKPGNTHFYPLTMLGKYFMYRSFNLLLVPRVFFAVLLHLYFLSLVYIFLGTLKLYRGVPSVLVLILFIGFNSANHQAYTWMSTYIGTLGSSIFAVLSLIYFVKFTDAKRLLLILTSVLMLTISIYFKEYWVFLFPVYLTYYFYRFSFPKKMRCPDGYFYYITITALLTNLFIRSIVSLGSQVGHIGANNFTIKNFLLTYFGAVFTSFSKFIFPPSSYYISLITNFAQLQSTEKIIISMMLIFGLLILVSFLKSSRINKNNKVLFGLLFSFSFLPFLLFSPNVTLGSLEARYYYVWAFPAALIIISLITDYPSWGKFRKVIFICAMCVFLSMNTFFNVRTFKIMRDNSVERQYIIDTIVSNIDSDRVGDTLIVYAKGLGVSYYGLPDLSLPFQTGLGNILAVHLFSNNKFITHDYFKNDETIILYNINSKNGGNISEGVFFFGDRSYGFFYDFDVLKQAVEIGDFSEKSIYVFIYDKGSPSRIDLKTYEELEIYSD